MIKGPKEVVFLAILAFVTMGVLAFIGFRYIIWKNMMNDLNNLTQQLTALEKQFEQERQDKEALVKEKKELQQSLAQANQEISEIQKSIDDLALQKQVNLALKGQLQQILMEKAQLEARLNSLEELKKSIRRVKLDIHQKKIVQKELKIKQQKELDALELAHGNRGFIIMDGKPTLLGKARVEVILNP